MIEQALIRLSRAMLPTDRARINTFAVIDNRSDLTPDNLNATVRDGRIAHFWGRRWEASGKDPASIQVDYSLLFLRHLDSEVSGSSICTNVEIGLVSLPECEGCATSRNETEIAKDNVRVLSNIVSELNGYKCFNMYLGSQYGGNGQGIYCFTPSEIEHLKEEGVTFPNLKNGTCNGEYVNAQSGYTIRTQRFGSANALISFTNFTRCDCESALQLDFSQNKEYLQYGETKCSTC